MSFFRSSQQVLDDLFKALHFSSEILERNRKGCLAAEQIKSLAVRCIQPAFLAFIFLLLPLLLWIPMISAQQQVSFLAAAPILFDDLSHLSQSIEAHGRFSALFRLGTVLLGAGLAVFMASRFPFALYFDILDGTVFVREGRLIAREEQTIRPNGRDPIEKYFLDMKGDRFQVNLAAFRAIESGALYVVYLLPRSQVLVSLEPKIAKQKAQDESALAG